MSPDRSELALTFKLTLREINVKDRDFRLLDLNGRR